MKEHNDQLVVSFEIEDDILVQSQSEKFPYSININQKKYIVLEQVFSPKYFPDIEMFTEYLPIKANSRFLEIGSGIGFTAIEAAYQGAKQVVATDINPYAIKNINQNIALHKFNSCINVRQGSVFEPIESSERFDIIYWNVPFQLVEDNKSVSLLQTSICDVDYQFIQEYITKGSDYLSQQGRLFMGFSSSIGSIDKLNTILAQLPYTQLRYEAKKKVIRNSTAVYFELIEIIYTKKNS